MVVVFEVYLIENRVYLYFILAVLPTSDLGLGLIKVGSEYLLVMAIDAYSNVLTCNPLVRFLHACIVRGRKIEGLW